MEVSWFTTNVNTMVMMTKWVRLELKQIKGNINYRILFPMLFLFIIDVVTRHDEI